MLEVKDLADATGLSKTQIRRRLSALDSLLDIQRGSSNKLLVDENALELLRRLEDYRESGLTVEKAVEQIRDELEDSDSVERCESNVEAKSNGELETVKRENELLRERVNELREETRWLRDRIETIEAKLPSPKEENNPLNEKSLWHVVKEWFKQPA